RSRNRLSLADVALRAAGLAAASPHSREGYPMIRRAAAFAGLLLLFSAATASAGSTHTVDIENYDFIQTPLTIPLGDQVQWHNTTSMTTHTSNADLFNLWATGDIQHGTTSGGVHFQQAGLFAYHCMIHPFMHGQVKVKLQSSPTSGTTAT